MSGADDLRAAREARAGAAERVSRSGPGDAMTRMVNAAVYRATHRPMPDVRRQDPPPHSTVDKELAPLGPDFRSAVREANARIDALGLAELRTQEGTIRYLDVGEGMPVLLVHGIFGGSDAALRQLRPLVPAGYRIIAPSRFGYLGSTVPAVATPSRQADVFADLLDRLGITETAVLAVSAGAASALQLAIRHSGRVSALVLLSVNGPGRHHDKPPLPRAIARALWTSDRLMWLCRRYFPARLARFLSVPADRARLDAELDGLFPVKRRVDGVLFDVFGPNPDINNHDLRKVAAPTLVVHAQDPDIADAVRTLLLSTTD